MAGQDIAKAYVQIVPSAKGIKNSLTNLLGEEAENAGKNAGGKFSGVFGTASKIGLAALGVAAAGVTALTKAAVGAYADYQQLVGGVETLFSSLDGTVSAAPQVLAAAENAYKTAGLSANDYMETVTSFSAALVSSLDGDYAKAAEISDMAITDMADNANKMGSSMESIQNAYQGFAKQNYTMLDNLKLGYGGTKEEMQRLLADAEAFSGVHYDISNLSDVYEAIHQIQKKMGIMGATADEAERTVSGSLGMMKASWQNLVAGFANSEADLGTLISNFVESAGIAAQNLVPVISQALSGIGQVVKELAPVIADELPGLITTLLPDLISAAADLVAGLIEALPDIITAIIQVLPGILLTIGDAIVNTLDPLITAGAEAAASFLEGVASWIGNIFNQGVDIVRNIINGIKSWFSNIVQKGREIVSNVVSGVRSAISQAVSIGLNVVQGIWQGISNGLGWIKSMISGWVGNVLDFIKRIFKIGSPSAVMRDEVGIFLAQGIGVGFEEEMQNVNRMMQNAMPDPLTLSASVSMSPASAGASGTGFMGELAAIRDEIRNMKIYLDTGVLVGAVDNALQTRALNATRRALA